MDLLDNLGYPGIIGFFLTQELDLLDRATVRLRGSISIYFYSCCKSLGVLELSSLETRVQQTSCKTKGLLILSDASPTGKRTDKPPDWTSMTSMDLPSARHSSLHRLALASLAFQGCERHLPSEGAGAGGSGRSVRGVSTRRQTAAAGNPKGERADRMD